MSKFILEQVFIDSVLRSAQQNVAQGQGLEPFLFLYIDGQPLTITPVVHPLSTQEKQAYFASLGAQLRRAGQVIEAAVFLAESWIVLATEAPAACSVRPSQHPSRREAIVAIGRDAANTRHSLVVQPFRRAEQHKPVWEPLAVASYNAPVEQGLQAVGLLDYLFAENQKR
jgi:hypothetical protein